MGPSGANVIQDRRFLVKILFFLPVKMVVRSWESYAIRQANNEGCPGTRLCFESKGAVMFAGYDVMGDGQSLTGALADFFGGEKRIKDLVLDILRDASAGVGNPDFHIMVVLSGAYGDPFLFSFRIVPEFVCYGMIKIRIVGGINLAA